MSLPHRMASVMTIHDHGPMSDGDREESGRVFGMPRRTVGAHARHDEEPKHVLGLPADWYGQVDWDALRALRHPIKACKRWVLIRRLGPYAPDHNDPRPPAES